MKSKNEPDRFGENDDSGASIDPVDHEQRERSYGWKEQLVTPTKVKHIIGKPKEYHTANGEEGTNELSKLEETESKQKKSRIHVCESHTSVDIHVCTSWCSNGVCV